MHIMYSVAYLCMTKKKSTKFIGFYMDEKSDKSENPKDYEWYEIKE